jgi:hypothetical protein
MNEQSPHRAGSAGSVGNKLTEPSTPEGLQAELRWDVSGRVHAALQELDVRPVDWDVVDTLLRGAVEAIDAAT